MKIKIHKTSLLLSIILLLTETLIAIYLKTGFIRHTFGDFLAVILLYSLVKSFIEIDILKLAFLVLLFAFAIEFLQLINIIEILNLQNNHFIKVILGSTFHVTDLVAYTLGVITILIIEFKIYKLWTI